MNTAKSLLELQATDQQLAFRRRAYRSICDQLEAQGGIPELKERTEKARVRELELKLETARLESELASLKENVARLEERLYSGAITNVRELTAIETEHNAARRQLAQVDEAIGPAGATAEDARKRHEDLNVELELAESDWKVKQKELQAEAVRIGQEYNDMGEARSEATTDIPPDDLALYNALLPTKGGVAVVRVERGVCQGCRVRIPLGEISRVRNSNGLVSCSSCGRILLSD